jgi:hypothetical protein
MGLSKKLARGVAMDVRARGRQYYHSKSVRILQGDAQGVRAEVDGTEVYRVSLHRRKKSLQVCCSCPYYQDRLVPCKHIWATILTADRQGLLQGPGDIGPQYLRECRDQDILDWVGTATGTSTNGSRNGAHPRERLHGHNGRRHGRRMDRGDRLHRTSAPEAPEALPEALAGEPALRDLPARPEPWPSDREILYVLDLPESRDGRGMLVDVYAHQQKKDGTWTQPRLQAIPKVQVLQLPQAADRELLCLLDGAREDLAPAPSADAALVPPLPIRYRLPIPVQDVYLSRMCATSRCRLHRSTESDTFAPLTWDDGAPWEFWLIVRRGHTQARSARDGSDTNDDRHAQYIVSGELRRGAERASIADPLLLMSGLVLWGDHAARLQDFGAFDWITLLRRLGTMTVPVAEKDTLLRELLRLPRLPRLDLPPELHFDEVTLPPRPQFRIESPPPSDGLRPERLRGTLAFDYDGEVIAADQVNRGVYQPDRHRFLLRDSAAEAAATEKLFQVGCRLAGVRPDLSWEVTPRNLPRVVKTLLEEGWQVEAEGKTYRRPGKFQIEVTSNIDWFELRGGVDFDGHKAHLPDLLAALRRGEEMVRLDDGTFGLIPQEWLAKFGGLANLGKAEGDHLRFGRTQVGVVDALAASQPGTVCDAIFSRLRQELHEFGGIKAVDPPEGFTGKLRGYQREGLGWLRFLDKFRFGGCLADDMGLGKTVQVLAFLEARRQERADALAWDPEVIEGATPRQPPSLIVVPRSLVFNWQQEAARFTPRLRIYKHTGSGRLPVGDHFYDYDVVLTTYGTMRRDIRHLREFKFDYCILDEAQAIKNAHSEAARAARLLQAGRRLALSGTPIENHLGELWSLFEFLNPGMLGSAGVFHGAAGRNPDETTRGLLARALRPFILRRTKEQVARDLPAKSEQTIICEMDPPQRRLYDELRAHYRDSLLSRIERDGIQRSRMHVLEALLRLRQAACHPGLVDKRRVADSSAKLDALLAQLDEVLDEGHKAIVFSQFTSLLAIVRQRLDDDGVVYEYLDGRTRNRQAKVERFQEEADCKLFLISVKAGGLGLNLTAAEYVFLLDPWWNPAVEAQAIDRAHRIGQTRPVFAYRLIAKDTVEEKILELQKTKRALADAIVGADNSMIRSLSQEDLEMLLS